MATMSACAGVFPAAAGEARTVGSGATVAGNSGGLTPMPLSTNSDLWQLDGFSVEQRST